VGVGGWMGLLRLLFSSKVTLYTAAKAQKETMFVFEVGRGRFLRINECVVWLSEQTQRLQ